MTVGELVSRLEKLDQSAQVAIATWSADGGNYWLLQQNAHGELTKRIAPAQGGGTAVLIGHFDHCQAHNAKHIFK